MTAPAPLVSPDVDVSRFEGFMLNVRKLLESALWASSTGEEFKAAVGLWAHAWLDHPPGSLPDDDRILAGYSGAGARWKKIKPVALRGFVKCSDGRIYHRVLCENVLEAWGHHQAFKARTANATEARRQRNDDRKPQRYDLFDGQRETQRNVDEIGEREKGESTSSLRSEAAGPAREARPAAAAEKKINETNGFHVLDVMTDRWNERAKSFSFPEVVELTDRRALRIRQMLDGVKAHGFSDDDAAMAFVLGKVDRSFFVHEPKRPLTFDQLISPDFWPQLIEGAFEYKPPQKRGRR